MPRRSKPHAQPESARETSVPSSEKTSSTAQASTNRLCTRVVQKADGRYLIYYERSPQA
ncbi:MAG: hypothetical protein M3082_07560 [Candidatus Dormibacteraeota bacterium]|nr:hypothetical protein [Candidatus Dormibacteraeota bacterium]